MSLSFLCRTTGTLYPLHFPLFSNPPIPPHSKAMRGFLLDVFSAQGFLTLPPSFSFPLDKAPPMKRLLKGPASASAFLRTLPFFPFWSFSVLELFLSCVFLEFLSSRLHLAAPRFPPLTVPHVLEVAFNLVLILCSPPTFSLFSLLRDYANKTAPPSVWLTSVPSPPPFDGFQRVQSSPLLREGFKNF